MNDGNHITPIMQVDLEQSVFTDVETMISQASDAVTSQGLELGSVVVEVKQSFVTNICSCKLSPLPCNIHSHTNIEPCRMNDRS